MVIAKDFQQAPASATTRLIGQKGVGADGDIIEGILITPITTSPGSVVLTDGAISIEIFHGGAVSLADLRPFYAKLGAKSINGAFSLVLGANVKATAFGRFQ